MTLDGIKHEAFWIAIANTADRAPALGDCLAVCSSCTIAGLRNLKVPLPETILSLLPEPCSFHSYLCPHPPHRPCYCSSVLSVHPSAFNQVWGDSPSSHFIYSVPLPPRTHYIGTFPMSLGLRCPCQHVVSHSRV